MTTPSDRARAGAGTALVRTLTLVVAIVFLVVGVLGFVPGITTNYSQLTFAGHMSDAKLVGLFEVSVLHNIVHLLYGAVGLVMARRTPSAVAYLVGGGAIYLVLWIYGLVVGEESAANFVPLNTADNWLHFLLGVGMIGLGLVGRQSAVRSLPETP